MSNLLETFNSIDKIENKYEEKKKKNIELNKIKLESISNIVSKEKNIKITGRLVIKILAFISIVCFFCPVYYIKRHCQCS